MGLVGLVMTMVAGAIMIYCFRNHEFLEPNVLKRRFHWIQIVMIAVHLSCIYFYYLNISIIIPMKHILAHIIGITTIVDFLV
jgi:hypothetical protein